MRKIYTLFALFAGLVGSFTACNKLERISAVRITRVEMLQDSLSAMVYGEVIDSEAQGAISDHGFCFSAGFADPRIGDENTDTVSLGTVTDENKIFSDTILLESPNTFYYVRAFITVNGKTIYGSPRLIKTREITIDDISIAVESTILSLGSTGSLTVKGFVNKKKIEADEPVTLVNFGTKVGYEPDSTQTHILIGTLQSADIIQFSNTHFETDLPPPGTANPQVLYVWAFAQYALISDPNDIRTIYTKRKTVRLVP